MREKVPVDTGDIEDQLDLLDDDLKQQIREGYEAYLRGETKDVETLIGELRDELKPQKT